MDEKALLRDHQKTFDGFIKLATYSIVAVVITLAFMALFLT